MVDWNLVKKMTLWDYEEIIKKIAEVFSYSFIQEHYNHTMKEATNYLEELLGYDVKLVLNHIFRWVFPHRLYLRELINTENESHKIYIKKLRNRRIRFNLDILENGRTREGREKLSKEKGIPESFILGLVNLADLSRLPYTNRKTVKNLLAG